MNVICPQGDSCIGKQESLLGRARELSWLHFLYIVPSDLFNLLPVEHWAVFISSSKEYSNLADVGATHHNMSLHSGGILYPI